VDDAGPVSAAHGDGLDQARASTGSCRAQALLVLREVYRAAPAHLVVTVLDDDDDDNNDDDNGDEDGWDDDAWPQLDCAALEALFGPHGRATSPR
jgi:hypothetical protein